ncbi:MAG: sigma-70 family RNA polymerase sigma factor [Bacteroidetes bacterium]|nr:sigma-70 family RNA polymerase sigma factor [Bacteroidota bacterium]
MRYRGSEIIIDGIRHCDRKILNEVYSANYPLVEQFVMNNFGSVDDAKDIFQETIIIIYEKIKHSDLELTCSFQTFLFSVCKNLWFKEIRWRMKQFDEDNNDYECLRKEEVDELFATYIINRESRLFYKHFNNLSEECRKIIKFYLEKIQTKEIASIMNYEGVIDVRRKKYSCKVTLIRNIREDPEFKVMMEHENQPELQLVNN